MADSEDSAFRIERRGNVTIIRPGPDIEALGWDLVGHAADVVLQPIRVQEYPLVLVALDNVNYFGSVFLSLLLRCWKEVSTKGGMMVMSGVSKRARELLRVTSLDTLWAIYDSEREAIGVLESE